MRHDNIEHGFKSGKPHGLRGQDLSFLDGQKSAANILGMVRTAAQYKAGYGCGVSIQVDAEIGQSEIEQKKLYQKRRSPKNHGISVGCLSDDRVAECTQRSDHDSEPKAEESRWNDQLDRHDQSPVQGRNQLRCVKCGVHLFVLGIELVEPTAEIPGPGTCIGRK